MIPIETLRERIGLNANDATKDALLNGVLETVVDLIEVYLDHGIRYDTYKDVFIHKSGSHVSLRAYPVEKIVYTEGIDKCLHIDENNGVVHFDTYKAEHEIIIHYVAGYKEFKGGLLLAALNLFDKINDTINNPGAGVSTAGAIKSTSIDGMRVEFDTGSSASTGAASSSNFPWSGFIDVSTASLLEPYRRRNA